MRFPRLQAWDSSDSARATSRRAISRRRSPSSSAGVNEGQQYQTLLGATGTGKTFTMANVIARRREADARDRAQQDARRAALQRVPRVLPDNAVEYFVSYYDYYQPEAYLPVVRHVHREGLLAQRGHRPAAPRGDVVAAAPPRRRDRRLGLVHLRPRLAERVRGAARAPCARARAIPRDKLLRALVDIQYRRNDMVLERGRFRARGDVVEVQPAYSETAYRISLFGDEVESITHFDPLSGEVYAREDEITIYPATHYVTTPPTIERAAAAIREELERHVAMFEEEGKLLEAHRLRQRTEYDLEMMQELGYCNGIENYSRVLDGRAPGQAPFTLLDYFPGDFLVIIDESHQTVPADRRHVRGRPLAQGVARRARLPAAARASTTGRCASTSSSSACRRRSSSRPRPGPYEMRVSSQGRRADHPPDRPDRSRGRGAADAPPDRRPAGRDPPARAGRRARAGARR